MSPNALIQGALSTGGNMTVALEEENISAAAMVHRSPYRQTSREKVYQIDGFASTAILLPAPGDRKGARLASAAMRTNLMQKTRWLGVGGLTRIIAGIVVLIGISLCVRLTDNRHGFCSPEKGEPRCVDPIKGGGLPA